MGYQTRYSLTIEHQGSDPVSKLLEEARVLSVKIPNYCDIEELIADGIDCKWYDHDEDMKKISADFPDILFKLEGEGEESGDIWKTYYKGGKAQHCRAKIVFPEFDPSKLK